MYESLLRRLSPKWLMRWLLLATVAQYIWQFLFGSLLGILVLALSSYAWMSMFSDTKPFTLAELAIWISDSPTEVKTAVATSLLTIVGFLAAFYSSTISWRTQERMRLQMKAAEEIQKFFSDALSATTSTELYVRRLRETHELLRKPDEIEGAEFKLDYVLGMTQKFLEDRARLSSMSVDVHQLAGRYYSLLSQTWMLDKALSDAVNGLSEIAADVWVGAPEFSSDLTNKRELFLRFVSVAECDKYLDTCRRHHGAISALVGGLTGALAAPIVGQSLATLMAVIKRRSVLEEAFLEVKNSTSRRQKH